MNENFEVFIQNEIDIGVLDETFYITLLNRIIDLQKTKQENLSQK